MYLGQQSIAFKKKGILFRGKRKLLLLVPLACRLEIDSILCALFDVLMYSPFVHRDPFFQPSEASDKKRARDVRLAFSLNSFSDHMVILKAFQVRLNTF